MVAGARAELHERMNRRPSAPAGRTPSRTRANNICWIAGTAEYQVARCLWTIGQKANALNAGGTTTVAPTDNEERTAPTSPCTWNSGITHMEMSSGDRA